MAAVLRALRWRPVGGSTVRVQPPTTPPARPLTQITGGGTAGQSALARALLSSSGATAPHSTRAKKWRALYRTGGVASTCIDAFPLFLLSNGYEFSCRDGCTAELDRVQAWADQSHINIHSLIWQLVLDSVITGTSFAEIVPDGGAFGIYNVVPRDSSMFTPIYDEFGVVLHYEQEIGDTTAGGLGRRIQIPPERMLTVTPFQIPGEIYGASLVERAYDDILRDIDTYESITAGIHRHGTQRYHIRVGAPGEPIPPEELLTIRQEFSRITAKNEWITTGDVEIKNVDVPMANLDVYSDISLQRLAASFGIPDEFLGRGSQGNHATATVRLRAFYTAISTIQDMVARSLSRSVLDVVSGNPGSVWLSFGEVSPENFGSMAVAFAQLRSGPDPEAVVPAAWARDQLGIPPETDDDDDDDDDDDIGTGVGGPSRETTFDAGKKMLAASAGRGLASKYIRRGVRFG
jgi:hypothetical protein